MSIIERLRDEGPHGQTEREARIVLYSLLRDAANEIERTKRAWLSVIRQKKG